MWKRLAEIKSDCLIYYTQSKYYVFFERLTQKQLALFKKIN
jgi:hypothetical protein